MASMVSMVSIVSIASIATRSCIRASRIIKFVAEVSSSMKRAEDPASRASTIDAAWEVVGSGGCEVEAVKWRL